MVAFKNKGVFFLQAAQSQFTSKLALLESLSFDFKYAFSATCTNDCSDCPRVSGIYAIIDHGLQPFLVYCDQTADGGSMLFLYICATIAFSFFTTL